MAQFTGEAKGDQLARRDRRGWLSAAGARLLDRLRQGTGAAADDTMLDSDRSIAIGGSLAVHLATNLKLRDDESAWDYFRTTGDPGQVLLLRSTGGGNTIEFYDAPTGAGTNPATLTNRLSLSAAQFVNAFVGPRGRVRRTTNLAIANITPTAITFDTSDSILANGYGGGTTFWDGGTALVARVAGWYIFSGNATFQNVGTGVYRDLSLYKNGAGYVTQTDSPHTASFFVQKNVASIIYMNVNDFIQLVAYQDSGAPLSIMAGTNGPCLHGIYICP